MGGLGSFTLGVAAALVAGATGPMIGRRLRPLARGIVKQAIILSDGARTRADEIREDLEDIVAEARLEVREERKAGAARSAAGAEL